MRLDHHLVTFCGVESRTKATNLIKESQVKVNTKIVTKPALEVGENDHIEVMSTPYVGRAALKLKGFLDHVTLSSEGREVLDVGSSTGGFAQVLLEDGACRVVCVDVGHDQLHPLIKNDPRVESIEGCDIRTFSSAKPFSLVTVDVSFISLHLLLDKFDELFVDDLVLLFKPQFEVGKGVKRNSAGVVNDQGAIKDAMIRFEHACASHKWEMKEKQMSSIEGKEGNKEYVYWYRKIVG